MVWILVALLGAVVFGGVLVAVGWRGKRLNRHPVCRDCGFDLSAVLPGGVTCPECGAGLRRERAVRIGQRRRRPLAIGLGLALVLLPGGLLGAAVLGAAAGVDVAAYKPVWLLSWEAERGGVAAVDALARELERREAAGALTGAEVRRAGEAVLAIQRDASAAWDERLGDFVEQQVLKGTLGDDAAARFAVGVANLEFVVRQRVAAGGEIVVEPRLTRVRAGTGSQFGGMLWLEGATLGGREVIATGETGIAQIGTFNVYHHPQWGRANDRAHGTGVIVAPEGLGPGRHGLRFTVRAVVRPPADAAAAARAGWTQEQHNERIERRTRRFEWAGEVVVEPAGTPVVEVVEPSEEMTRTLKAALGAGQVTVWDSGSSGTMMRAHFMGASAVPVPVVGRAVARWRGKEWEIGRVLLRGVEGDEPLWVFHDGFTPPTIPEGFDAEEIDVAVVPDVAAALRTADVTRIYGGELVFRNVAVEWQDVERGRVRKPSGLMRVFGALAEMGAGKGEGRDREDEEGGEEEGDGGGKEDR